ncbi:MAG: DUF3368 domain-containing protein [Planctomycetaceae bacterium]|jgi:predicted nucleic acid-binding protein|nr:DUF3368 domain-containing protein [Planctomycetaceae bacterium]
MLYPEIIISDTSCLINLERIDAFSLLEKIFGKIVVTKEVAAEFGQPLPESFEIRSVPVQMTQELQTTGLDLGESRSIALALILQEECYLLLDDQAARQEAVKRNLNITGLLGVLLLAKKRGIIRKIKPYIERLQKVNFRMSQKLIQEVLRDAKEI